jgi:hypothetical protein
MTRKTTQNKKDLVNTLDDVDRVERLSLAEGRDKLFEKFYNNIRILVATETISMVDLARQLGMKSGKRIYDLNYGRGTPSTEELIALSKHYKCTIDDLLNKTARISFEAAQQQNT